MTTVVRGSVLLVDEPVNDSLEVIARRCAELEAAYRDLLADYDRLEALLSWKYAETDFRGRTTSDDGGDW